MDNITVIVPVYNVANYLCAGLDSLLAQEWRDWTAICVDDGSTDESGAILDEYAARDARFTVVHQANGGVSSARNVGLARAMGEVVLFMDPDDVVAPNWIARMVAEIVGVDAVLAGYGEGERLCLSRDEGAVYEGRAVQARFWRAFFGYRLRDLPKIFLPGGLWKRCDREMAGVWRCAVRRAVVGDLRFDERLSLYEDAIFLSQLALRVGCVRIAGDCGYRWFVRESGAMLREAKLRKVENKFAVRDARRRLDPKMTHWRGSFVLSFFEVLRAAGIRAAGRFLV